MGSGGSKEVVLPANPQASSAFVQASANAVAESERRAQAAASAYRDAEDKIFQEGYKRGSEEALNRIDSEVERHARAAYARALLEEEERRAAAVKQEASRLGKSYYKAPQRTPACQAEEAAVLACDPSIDKARCAQVVDAYTRCADTALTSLMRPSLK